MSVPGEKPTLTIIKQSPEVLVEWAGGLPPFQLQRTLNFEQIIWEAVGKPTLARAKRLLASDPSSIFRLQSEVPQFDVDLSGGQTRLFWDVPDLAGSTTPVPDIYPWPFPGYKPAGWTEWQGGNHAATWDYQEHPITGHPSIGFAIAGGITPIVQQHAMGAFYQFAQAYSEIYITFLFKSLTLPTVRAIEICDLYDHNELCNIYLYPQGGQYGGGIGLFMREGYGGVTSPIPINQDIRIWLHFKRTATGSVSDVAWSMPDEPRPVDGPQVVNGGNTTIQGDIVKLLFGPVDIGTTFVYADLRMATFPLDTVPASPDAIDHFVLNRRVPESLDWETIATPGPEAREYIDAAVPSPSLDYWLRGVTTQGQEWDYSPIIRVTEQNPAQFIWQRKFGSTSPSGDNHPYAVTAHTDGSVAVGGYFAANIDLGAGPINSNGVYDGFIGKYSSDGAYLWGRNIGGSDTDYIKALAFDSQGNLWATVQFQSPNLNLGNGFGPYTAVGVDIVLFKLDGVTGQTVFARHFPSAGQEFPWQLSVDAQDNVIFCGGFGANGGWIDLGFGQVFATNASTDGFVAKYSSNGTPLWSQIFTSNSETFVASVSVNQADGSIAAAGKFTSHTTVAGQTVNPAAGGLNVFLAKFNSGGSLEWLRGIGGPATQVGGVASSPSGVALVGAFSGTVDFGNGKVAIGHGAQQDMFLACYDQGGECQWVHNWGTGFGGDFLASAAWTPGGDVVVTGWLTSFVDMGGGFLPQIGGQDVVIARFTAASQHVWSRRYGGFGLDYGTAIAAVSLGGIERVAAVGTFAATIDFGGGALTSGGQLKTSFIVLLTG